ncbi:SWIM zinc finger family protein [Actinomadura sp. ATCC 39365]
MPLLPTVGDLEPECSCPDWGHPCKHAAALCYQASWLLDGDPFVLLLLRGRGEQELIEALQNRDLPVPAPTRATGGGTAEEDASGGVPAAQAFAAGEPPLPEPPPREAAYTPSRSTSRPAWTWPPWPCWPPPPPAAPVRSCCTAAWNP